MWRPKGSAILLACHLDYIFHIYLTALLHQILHDKKNIANSLQCVISSYMV